MQNDAKQERNSFKREGRELIPCLNCHSSETAKLATYTAEKHLHEDKKKQDGKNVGTDRVPTSG